MKKTSKTRGKRIPRQMQMHQTSKKRYSTIIDTSCFSASRDTPTASLSYRQNVISDLLVPESSENMPEIALYKMFLVRLVLLPTHKERG